MRDHKEYIYVFSWADEKMFSVESPKTFPFFLNRKTDLWTRTKLLRSDVFNTLEICVLFARVGLYRQDKVDPK